MQTDSPGNPRHATIIELLRRGEPLTVRGLAARFGVSSMTIRRDLRLLESRRLLIRTRGGGTSAGDIRFLQEAFSHYIVSPEKVAIGRLAATFVTPGQTIMLDAGTTALEVARALPRDVSLTVVTSSLCVAQTLYQTSVNVILLGGILRRDFPGLIGTLAEQILQCIHVDTLFIGCDGARSDQGFYIDDVQHASLVQAMMRAADRVIVIAESTKFSSAAFMRYATISEVHALITDEHLCATDRDSLEAQGVTLHLVHPD